MTIKEYRKFINALPKKFDDFELTHREYTTTEGDSIKAKEVEVYSVHIDEDSKVGCNMHRHSYEAFIKFTKSFGTKLPSPPTEIDQ